MKLQEDAQLKMNNISIMLKEYEVYNNSMIKKRFNEFVRETIKILTDRVLNIDQNVNSKYASIGAIEALKEVKSFLINDYEYLLDEKDSLKNILGGNNDVEKTSFLQRRRK